MSPARTHVLSTLEEPNVPIGPGNSVEAGGPDQGQLTLSCAQRTQFVFRVRVPRSFAEGKQEVVWTLTSHGETNTAHDTLQPDYYADDIVIVNDDGAGGGGANDIGNTPPLLEVLGDLSMTVSVGQPVTLTAVAPPDLIGDASLELVPARQSYEAEVSPARRHVLATLEEPNVISVGASNSLDKMIAHQVAAAHDAGMDLLGRVAEDGPRLPPVELARLTNAAARLFKVAQNGCVTLQRMKTGGQQTVVVQHVNVEQGGQAVVAAPRSARASHFRPKPHHFGQMFDRPEALHGPLQVLPRPQRHGLPEPRRRGPPGSRRPQPGALQRW